jgi:hypothetical protein
MKRFLGSIVALALAAGFAACGGDDDDDSGSSNSSGSGSEVAAGDFCEIWPSLNSDQEELVDDPTEEQLDEARELLASARASAPEEIEDEVGQMVGAIEGIVDQMASGEELDPEALFGEIFALAFSAGPPIEAWLVENCPDYEPEDPFAEEDGAESTGPLGIPQGDIDELRFAIFEDHGASTSSFGDEYEWTIYFEGEADAAVAQCQQLAEELAAHADASGTLKLTIELADGTVLAVNEAITPGDAGSCEAG